MDANPENLPRSRGDAEARRESGIRSLARFLFVRANSRLVRSLQSCPLLTFVRRQQWHRLLSVMEADNAVAGRAEALVPGRSRDGGRGCDDVLGALSIATG